LDKLFRQQLSLKVQAFWDETKSFFTMKGRISAYKESKNTCEPVFSITKKAGVAFAELLPQGQNR
jgi:hypothetical protein